LKLKKARNFPVLALLKTQAPKAHLLEEDNTQKQCPDVSSNLRT